jgi:NitT/TauT family transport system substrate-binding protein
VFESSKLPGEIVDALIVNTQVLKDNPELGKALTGAWFEMLGVLAADTPDATAAKESMAAASGTDLAGYQAQLDKTKLFVTPADMVAFVTDPKMKETQDIMRKFLFDKGLLGTGATSPDAIGVSFPDGSVIGDPKNVKLHIDAEFATMAAEGKL